MAEMPAGSVDSIVTDPPYGLSFMGKGWDHGVPGVEFWEAALRVAKPGAHLLAFGGTRTFHRLTVAIEDAGWEVRDCLMWVYGSGFPKSHDVSKAIDREAGAERETVLIPTKAGNTRGDRGATYATETHAGFRDISTAQTDAARQWQGWGTALKPAWEPIILARKPLSGTVAANVLEHGTGAINVDGCRVAGVVPKTVHGVSSRQGEVYGKYRDEPQESNPSLLGRWPANLIHDGSEEVVGLMAEAARFFYCPKASKRDRDEGCEGLEAQSVVRMATQNGASGVPSKAMERFATVSRNHHPTVKPTDLMRYLCRLVTPPGGLVLDPFGGSGSTGKAALLEGFRVTLCELLEEYWPIIEARCKWAANERPEGKVSAMVQRTLFSGD